MSRSSLFAAGLAPLLLLASAPTPAAESYDNCAGFIDSIPTTISSQGVWCMRADASAALASGSAISVSVNNVTIDCNGYKLGNLGAGPGNAATGIVALNPLNVTVRDCNLRGYYLAVLLVGGGHLVEDTRAEANGYAGLQVAGDGSTVRRNFVFDTGTGVHDPAAAIMTSAQVDVLDNTISGVVATNDGSGVMGIRSNPGIGGRIEGNAISGLVTVGGTPYGIFIDNSGGGLSVARNRITNGGTVAGSGVQCAGLPKSMLVDNHMLGFTDGWVGCEDVGLNFAQ